MLFRTKRSATPEHALTPRHHDGLALLDAAAGSAPDWPQPTYDRLPDGTVPEVGAADLTPEVVRAALLRSGCLLVRGLVPQPDVDQLVAGIDDVMRDRADTPSGGGAYAPFVPDPQFDLSFERTMPGNGDWGGMWTADAPRVAEAMFGAFDRSGLLALARGYLGEPPAISVHKCLLRRVKPPEASEERASASSWHQDGAFLGDVRALNVWVALSRCGDVAPGMDVVPRRLDEIVPTGTEGAVFEWSVSQAVAEQAAGEAGIARPIFEPRDLLLFDEMFLHATAAEPEMTGVRYAIECWFFGPSRFPQGYAPLAT